MNEQPDLLKRLLKLYPTKVLKENFDSKLSGDELYDHIVATNNHNIIKNFAYINFNHTKQHIYVFTLLDKFKRNHISDDNFPFKIEKTFHDAAHDNGNYEYSFICTPKVQFDITLKNPLEEAVVEFLQPIKFTFTKTHLVIQLTIIEKSQKSFFVGAREVKSSSKITSEIEFMNVLTNKIDELIPISPCDLNKGIKELLETDMVDFSQAQWKKENSVSTQTMDGQMRMKLHDPEAFNQVLLAPIKKSVFVKVENEDISILDKFSADPSSGIITIPKYSENLNQIPNVITKIISNN